MATQRLLERTLPPGGRWHAPYVHSLVVATAGEPRAERAERNRVDRVRVARQRGHHGRPRLGVKGADELEVRHGDRFPVGRPAQARDGVRDRERG